MVFNKYHLWRKSVNTVMNFWKLIKSILNIDKTLAATIKKQPERKTKQKIRQKPCKGNTYEAREEDNHEWKPKGHSVKISHPTLSAS